MERYRAPVYLVGLDLGKKRDFTALTALKRRSVRTGRVERTPSTFDLERGTTYTTTPTMEHHYDMLHLDRWRGRSYRDVVPEAKRVIDRLDRDAQEDYFEHFGRGDLVKPTIHLLVDQTGVGESVVNDIIRAAGLKCIGITITGGTAVSRDGQDYRVPKRELVGRMEVVVENRRLRFPSPDEMPIVNDLLSEMDNFTAKTNLATGHDSYGAGAEWRVGNHDDMVLALAMAVWFGEHGTHKQLRAPRGGLAAYLARQ